MHINESITNETGTFGIWHDGDSAGRYVLTITKNSTKKTETSFTATKEQAVSIIDSLKIHTPKANQKVIETKVICDLCNRLNTNLCKIEAQKCEDNYDCFRSVKLHIVK